MKVIVFGGAGFLGSHVADALTAAGHTVTIFDHRPAKFRKPEQNLISGTIQDLPGVLQAVKGQDVVYNFAGIADIDECLKNPIETVQVNVLGCVNQLEAAKQARIKRFVFASSIYVYSESGGFYRASKQSCEQYIEEYNRLHNLEYTILRYGTIYGRRADEHNSVYRYLRQAIQDKRITVIGNEDSIREYIHVQDAAQASVQILSPEFKNQNMTITGHHPMRLRDLMKMIREIVGPDLTIEYKTPGAEGLSIGHYDITPYKFHPKIAKKLASNCYYDMGQGLLDCLEEMHSSSDPSR